MKAGGKNKLIAPEQALALVLKHAPVGLPVKAPLVAAGSHVAAEDIAASAAYPWFSFSAMDGYAVASADLVAASADNRVTLPVDAEIRAGNTERMALPRGRAMRIMTGAPLPEGADSVVPREEVGEEGQSAVFSAAAEPGRFINRAGEEIAAGEVVWRAGEMLTPAGVGLLAALGVDSVSVYPRPVVSVVSTGDELVEPGEARAHGQIFDSLTPALSCALADELCFEIHQYRCPDDRESLYCMLGLALEKTDLALVAGGVSVGDYDFSLPVFERLEVRKIFHGVDQKPGKPLYFGKKGEKAVFGLPGNPASALACFYLYVRPAVRRFAGFADPRPAWKKGRLAGPVENRQARTHFVRGQATLTGTGWEVKPAGRQSSYMLVSFSRANALVKLPPGPVSLAGGEEVDFLLL